MYLRFEAVYNIHRGILFCVVPSSSTVLPQYFITCLSDVQIRVRLNTTEHFKYNTAEYTYLPIADPNNF